MEVKSAKNRKEKAEQQIQEILDDFTKATGFKITGLDLMFSLTHGSPVKHIVKIEIDL